MQRQMALGCKVKVWSSFCPFSLIQRVSWEIWCLIYYPLLLKVNVVSWQPTSLVQRAVFTCRRKISILEYWYWALFCPLSRFKIIAGKGEVKRWWWSKSDRRIGSSRILQQPLLRASHPDLRTSSTPQEVNRIQKHAKTAQTAGRQSQYIRCVTPSRYKCLMYGSISTIKPKTRTIDGVHEYLVPYSR